MRTFKEAVLQLPEIKECFCEGLDALKRKDKDRIIANNTRLIQGSVDLDGCSNIPNKVGEKRWDYLVAYSQKVIAVEVHSTNGGNALNEALEKSDWLTKWIGTQNTIRVEKQFVLVGSGRSESRIPDRLSKVFAKKGIILSGRRYLLDSHPAFTLSFLKK
jgi:hypothetical protein